MAQGGNNFCSVGEHNQGWMGVGNSLSRSSSCSSLDIAASLFSSLQAAEQASAANNIMNNLNNMMDNSNVRGNMNATNTNQAVLALAQMMGVPQGSTMPSVNGNVHQGTGNGVVRIEDLQRLLTSQMSNQNGNGAAPTPTNPTNQLQSLANQYHQLQQQIEQTKRTELENLVRLQLQQQQSQNGNTLFPSNGNGFAQNFTVPTTGFSHQYNPASSTTRNEMQFSHSDANPVSIKGGDTRSSHGSLSAVSLLQIWNNNQGNNFGNSNALTSDNFGAHHLGFQGNNVQASNVPMVYDEVPKDVTFVPTKDPSPSLSFTKSNDTDSQAHSLADGKRSRSNSTSSFEALLSAVNDDLVEFHKEKREAENVNSDYGQKTPTDFANHHLSVLFGMGDGTAPNTNASMLQAHQGGQNMADQQFMSQTHPFSVPSLQGSNVNMHTETNGKKKKQKKQKRAKRKSSSGDSNCEIEMAIKRLSSHLNDDPFDAEDSVEEPSHSHRKGLDHFLETYGEDAIKAKDSMLKAIEDSESSLAKIHEWDRSLGLRKCSNRTVVKTRRSRAQLKAFLQGMKPPKEPKARSKKRKSSLHSL